MNSTILHISGLSKSFEGLRLFDNVNIGLKAGTINSLLGGNGSGKTTFFNIICGFEKADSGKIIFKNREIKYHNETNIARAGIGKMWQEPTIFPNHTVLQNLMVSSKYHPGEFILNYIFRKNSIKAREEQLEVNARVILQKFNLINKTDQTAGSLSLGEKKLLAIAMLLQNGSDLLLLDEPFSNVNPATIDRISSTLVSLRETGKTIFMIEHKIRFAMPICDHNYKIENHQLIPLN